MLPYIEVFSHSVPMYGVMAGAGILLAVLYLYGAQRRCPEIRADAELTFVYGLIGMAVGAKLLALLTELPELIEALPLLWQSPEVFLQTYLLSGFVFYGGLYGALLAVWLYGRHSRCGVSALLRALLPVIPLIHAFGRLGCFCAGCCYGKASQSLGIAFSCSEIAPNGVALLPVQLIEAGWELLLLVLLWQLSRRGRSGWRMLGLYLLLYSLERFVLEFWRGDAYRGFIGPLALSQWIALLSVAVGTWLLLRPRKK